MRKTIVKLMLGTLAAVFMFTACKKDSSLADNRHTVSQTAKRSSPLDGGTIHNDMLEYYYSIISNDDDFFDDFTTENYQTLFLQKLKPMTRAYFTEFYPDYDETLIDEMVDSAYYFTTHSDALIGAQSTNFQDFCADFKALTKNYANTEGFSSRIDDLETEYLALITDPLEILAVENGCSVAKGSNSYWSINDGKWDALFPPSTNEIHEGKASYGDLVLADAWGAVTGVISGGIKGAALGPGGATAGGMIGLVAGAASSTATTYGLGKIYDWFW